MNGAECIKSLLGLAKYAYDEATIPGLVVYLDLTEDLAPENSKTMRTTTIFCGIRLTPAITDGAETKSDPLQREITRKK
jgi:hypothetical protein